jgi:hypothetical protein
MTVLWEIWTLEAGHTRLIKAGLQKSPGPSIGRGRI